MKKNILTLIYIGLICSCSAQKNLVENQIINCQNEIYRGVNYDLKKAINDYEILLIEGKLLEDNSGKSYITLLNRILANKNFQIDSLISFYDLDPWYKVNESIKTQIQACENNQVNHSTKWTRILTELDSIAMEENQPDPTFRILLDNLIESDFELYFYKLKTFLAIEMINSKFGERQPLPLILSEDN